MKKLLSPDLLRELLSYDRETGELMWKRRGVSMFSSARACNIWNARYAGKVAGSAIGNHGYRIMGIFDTTHLCHRVIWAIETGSWPTCVIDHANQDRLDNRFHNLREASRAENAANAKLCGRNKTGIRGVHKLAGHRWVAQIKADGKSTHLGTFPCPAAASFAYQIAAEREYGRFFAPRQRRAA